MKRTIKLTEELKERGYKMEEVYTGYGGRDYYIISPQGNRVAEIIERTEKTTIVMNRKSYCWCEEAQVTIEKGELVVLCYKYPLNAEVIVKVR